MRKVASVSSSMLSLLDGGFLNCSSVMYTLTACMLLKHKKKCGLLPITPGGTPRCEFRPAGRSPGSLPSTACDYLLLTNCVHSLTSIWRFSIENSSNEQPNRSKRRRGSATERIGSTRFLHKTWYASLLTVGQHCCCLVVCLL